jgi:hypothetical protein
MGAPIFESNVSVQTITLAVAPNSIRFMDLCKNNEITVT